MKIKIGDLTKHQLSKICKQRNRCKPDEDGRICLLYNESEDCCMAGFPDTDKYEDIEVEISEDDHKKERTYGDIYREVAQEYPYFIKGVTDWRPIGPGLIQFWTKNSDIYHYNDSTKELYRGRDVYLK